MSTSSVKGVAGQCVRKVFSRKHPDRPRWSATKTLNIVCGMTIAWMLVWMVFGSYLHFGVEQQVRSCLPWRYYFITTRPPSVIHRDDVYQFTAEGQPLIPNGTRVVKYVAAVPGDHVVVNASGIYINGKRWGPINPKTLVRGHMTMKEIKANYIVPKGKLVVLGVTKWTWDSRFWGPINASQVTGRAFPIW